NTDTNGFDYKRYPNPPVVGTEGTKGKIAKIVLNAIRPGGGACGIPAAVPIDSKGWLLALAALLSVMTALGFRNRHA
ncbi:MAG: hypothetical protein LBP52_00120, partial [Burkholderiaceae bacterium]|nr:hypothetical protein [Burkholderiaceae bacterium]